MPRTHNDCTLSFSPKLGSVFEACVCRQLLALIPNLSLKKPIWLRRNWNGKWWNIRWNTMTEIHGTMVENWESRGKGSRSQGGLKLLISNRSWVMLSWYSTDVAELKTEKWEIVINQRATGEPTYAEDRSQKISQSKINLILTNKVNKLLNGISNLPRETSIFLLSVTIPNT